ITNMKSLLKPSINWLLVFVPVAIVLRIWPQFGNETALFICSCCAVVPLAGWMDRSTEELAEHLGRLWTMNTFKVSYRSKETNRRLSRHIEAPFADEARQLNCGGKRKRFSRSSLFRPF